MRKKLYLGLCCVWGIGNVHAAGNINLSAANATFPQDLSLPELIR